LMLMGVVAAGVADGVLTGDVMSIGVIAAGLRCVV
jgi:hypothetical protein